MAKKLTQTDINRIVWKACDTFRGTIDATQYKDYILTMLFLKYVTDVWKDKRAAYMVKYNNDEVRIERALRSERFQLPAESSFDNLFEQRNESNLGELINIGLEKLEDANRSKLERVFRNIDFNSEANLGQTKDRNRRLKNLLADFSELDLQPSHLEGNDIIGDAYEYLIAQFASDAGKKAGEFYTPATVSTLLAKLLVPEPGNRICDPTCGSGSLLIKMGKEVGNSNFSLYGQENNGSTWALARMNMFLHELDNATIEWGDTINNPKLLEGDQLMKFHIVGANPPFSLDKWGAEDALADQYRRFHRGVPPKSKGDFAFITHMIETAYEDIGRVGVIVPHGVLFRGSTEGKIREQLIKENLLEAVIGLPANLFFGTGIPAAILIFNKGKGDNKDVLFIDASQEFEAGKNQNRLREDKDIPHIVDTYKAFKIAKPLTTEEGQVLEDKYSYRATVKEIEENDYNLNIPRYVDTFEEEPEVDIVAVQAEIGKLEAELKTVQAEMDTYLKDLLNEQMDLDSPLSGGLLVVGSLLWDKHETRVSLRNEILNMQKSIVVPAPIRYGRKSEKRQTYTMVVSPSCKDEARMGKGVLIPFTARIKTTEELINVAEKIIVAERKENVSPDRFNWGWGCLAFLSNPNKASDKNIIQLKEYWSTKISNGFNPTDYRIAQEEQLLTNEGELLLDWKKEYGDLDFLVITATKPSIPLPTIQLLAAVFAKDDEYFTGNRKGGIETYQDNEIQELLNLKHEEKS